jgi:hypothetical protein
VNQFVEECRREWRRLRVPESIAEDMALELEADLEEAESEGVSAEDVLGRGAADSRSFAASWAAERGVVPPPSWRERISAESLAYGALAALTVVAGIGAALTIFAPLSSPKGGAIWVARDAPSAGASAIRRVVTDSDMAFRPLPGTDVSGVNTTGSILLIVGIAGIVLALLFLLWATRHVVRRESMTG